ncbi:uncharacterized protein LOC106874578 [Octopus bimaculoides]|uniref:uncharacterized protein LOC106874578 n=1 Tax=Octopus bimaculoides TaxID=37653 RepID=UPI00071DAF36|nr:uncharacterized protein LOC106874578 [Octopus bimaculoides]|eukprot:XP_014777843.1 PREDICTED: uncharacterized protein LOC106874578 [Octopus bimaculoides]
MSCTMSTSAPGTNSTRNGLCNPVRSRSRSLNDLPGGLKVPLLKRPERLKPRIQAVLAGLDELRLLKDQHKSLVDEAKYGDISNTINSDSMQDLFTQQAKEWLSNCRTRLSVTNLEKICEESVKDENSRSNVERNPSWKNNNNQTNYRRQTKRPVSVSGYPGLEHYGRSDAFRYDLGCVSNRLVEWTNPLENIHSELETFSTMRRASFQCHAVLTKRKGEMSPLTASREYPSPMHAVLRQYHSKIDEDDKILNAGSDSQRNVSSTKTKNQICNCLGVSKDVKINRRGSFTVGMNYNKDFRVSQFDPLLRRASSSDIKKVSRRSFDFSLCQFKQTSEEPRKMGQKASDNHTHKYTEYRPQNDVDGSQRHVDKQSGSRGLNKKQDHSSNSKENSKPTQNFSRSSKTEEQKKNNVQLESSVCRNTVNLDKNSMSECNRKRDTKSDSNTERYSEEFRKKNNLKNENNRIPTKHNSQTENDSNRSFHIAKGDNLSFTSDEGYGASVASTPRERRQLSIHSDTSWISADTHDNRSCDFNCENKGNDTNLIVNPNKSSRHVYKSGVNVSTNNWNLKGTTPFQSKVLPFKQTSL